MDNSLEIALKQEGVDGDVANIARSIYQQESGSGKNATTSNAGARGGMQIIPSTFNRMADKGWAIDNPIHNARAGVRYINALYTKADGDPTLTAAGYYGGEGAIPKAKKGIAVSDPRNPNAPNTLEYGKQVADRLPNAAFSADEDAKFQAMYQQEKKSFSANEDAKFQAMYDAERKPAQPSAASKLTAPAKDGSMTLKDMQAASRGSADVKLKDVAGGIYRGALDVGGGLAMPLEYAYDKLRSPDMSELITGKQSTHDARVKRIDDKFAKDYDANSNTYKNSRTGGQIAATLPVGGVLGAGAKAVGMEALGNALASGGMTLGKEGGNIIVNGATRIAGGVGTGAASEALVNNGDYGMGAGIGGALPIVAKAAGLTGKALSYLPKYLTDKGQNNLILDNLLKMVGGNKEDFINRLYAAKGSTEGFKPTAGQAGGEPAIASFERAVQQRNPELFKGIVNNQNFALANAAKGLGGDESTIAAHVANRDKALQPLYDTAKDTEVVSDDLLAELMKRPNVLQAFKAASKNAANRGENLTAGQWIESGAIHDGGAPEKVSTFYRPETAKGEKISGGNEDNLMQSIKKMGGIDLREILDITGEKTGRAARAQVGIFHKNGLGIDDLASQLHDAGYIPADEMATDGGVSYLKDAIKNHLGGDKQYALHDQPFYSPDVNYLKGTDYAMPNRAVDGLIDKKDIYKGKTLQEVKFALDKFKEFNPMASSSEKATRAGAVDASTAFNEYLGNKIPSMKTANALFSTLSKPIDQLKVGNALHEKFVPAIYRGEDSPVFNGGANSLNIATLSKLLRNKETGDNLAKHVTGYSGATLKNSTSPAQYKALENIVSDTEFMNYGKTAGSNGGSQTAQLQFMNSKGENNGMLSHLMKNGSLTMRAALAVKEFAVKPLEQKTAFLLQHPQESAKLLGSRLSKLEKHKLLVNLITSQAKLVAPVVAASQSR